MQIFRCTLLILWLAALSMPAPAQEHWRRDIDAFRRMDSLSPPLQGGILFVGSSTFNLWRDYAAYFPGYAITNRGFGGSSLRDVLYFYELLVKPHAPKQIVLYEGDNDLNRDDYTVSQFMDDVACFVHLTRVCYPDCIICIVSIKPSPARRQAYTKYAEANRQLKAFCEKQAHGVHFIDIWSLMVDDNDEPRANTDYFLSDRLHLNAAGYALLAAAITPCLIVD
ncbi:MAG: GDSL-type esterase/lipase family protein [Prevotellaceae bacterium]|jgi:lysophospholipase L1-like esterase|nr:GDSL-type esterase/lipase family protein [Prevotellaceae bacterium]